MAPSTHPLVRPPRTLLPEGVQKGEAVDGKLKVAGGAGGAAELRVVLPHPLQHGAQVVALDLRASRGGAGQGMLQSGVVALPGAGCPGIALPGAGCPWEGWLV